MNDFVLQHRRSDGTFVVLRGGYPYHVIAEDPIFADVAAAAEGVDLPPEEALAIPLPPPRLPTPLEWMDRLPVDRQIDLLEALDQSPAGRRFKLRLGAAREIDPQHSDTVSGVTMMRQAGVLTQDEADLLLT